MGYPVRRRRGRDDKKTLQPRTPPMKAFHRRESGWVEPRLERFVEGESLLH